ncbi:PIG-L deacetylase family protein [Adhaeribacter rhizoryzae]|uniref:PIG-L family deacetylase n=1 Tax=Adhaeribacter rhizoryzae TaxID=2607907 RepID=A0A5M6DE44_9BACT|nr:PIG-L family deacetylase [Adhaeribacter rhizoryzae]KAA5545804.1 PIG-L family deacetylase [Adhaeribacter rhizoryzae]
MKKLYSCLFLFLFLAQSLSAQNNKIRVIVFGAHPDDCDISSGGLAALYVAAGHAVKFVSLTNGDKGHQQMDGPALAKRRLEETREVARRLGVTYEVLNNHDGELMPTLENRLEVIRRIREWKADIVIAPRPNDYHPDHRYTGILVQDAAYLVIVPNILPKVAPLANNPLFLYSYDDFQRPNPSRADISVDITAVYDKKVNALDAHASQVYEWLPWTVHDKTVPVNPQERKKWLADKYLIWSSINPEIRQSLEKWYGKDQAAQAKQAEVFEICEYGKRPTEADIRRLFPMLPPK